jgi:hypothetical protein
MKKSFAKSQTLGFRNGMPSHDKPIKPVAPRKRAPPELIAASVVLKFEGYFVERVNLSGYHEERIRKCVIRFHLEDDTITVLEPKVKNSGIPQGILIKRSRIPKNATEFYSFEDFTIGAAVNLFGKLFTITNTSQDTRVTNSLHYIELMFVEECVGGIGNTSWRSYSSA